MNTKERGVNIKSLYVQKISIKVINNNDKQYISLTDIAKKINSSSPADIIKNWLRNKNTISFLGLWEKLNNPDFNIVEFDQIINKAGYHYFTLSPKKWIISVNAIGLISKSGKYDGGTYAISDIAFEFASWISPEFKLYLIKEFERLKKEEAQEEKLTWESTRILSKINYAIHTESIKNNLIPELTIEQQNTVYKNEADILNVAVFGMTANEWKKRYPNKAKDGNIRDYASLIELIILSNLEAMNSLLIEKNFFFKTFSYIKQGSQKSDKNINKRKTKNVKEIKKAAINCLFFI